MATINAKKPCAKCSNGSAVTTCDGCQQSFCTKHFVEHRHDLFEQMENINKEHDFIRRDSLEEAPKHPFFNRIDTWERESISKIQAAAEKARTDLQQLLDRTKTDLKLSIEKLTKEFNACQQSDNFTENDLKRWTEKLKELRKNLDAPSTIFLINDEDTKSSIRLIRISDKQSKPPPSQQQQSIQRPSSAVIRPVENRISNIKELIHLTNEKFGEIDGKAVLSEDNYLATCCLASILTQPIIYGANRYSTGKHHIRFRIEKLGDLRLFFGIIRSLENISRSGQSQNSNNSLYGWWDLNEAIVNGRIQTTKYRHIVSTGDELTLTLDCDNKQIQLQHHRTKRLAQLSIDTNKCPFPWKIVIRLQSAGDCVRILQ